MGGNYINKKIGSCQYSDISVFSLHPVKTITSGEGGLITTNNSQLYKKGYYNINQAMNPWKDDWNLSNYKQEKLKIKRDLKGLKKFALTAIINDKISWGNQ